MPPHSGSDSFLSQMMQLTDDGAKGYWDITKYRCDVHHTSNVRRDRMRRFQKTKILRPINVAASVMAATIETRPTRSRRNAPQRMSTRYFGSLLEFTSHLSASLVAPVTGFGTLSKRKFALRFGGSLFCWNRCSFLFPSCLRRDDSQARTSTQRGAPRLRVWHGKRIFCQLAAKPRLQLHSDANRSPPLGNTTTAPFTLGDGNHIASPIGPQWGA